MLTWTKHQSKSRGDICNKGYLQDEKGTVCSAWCKCDDVTSVNSTCRLSSATTWMEGGGGDKWISCFFASYCTRGSKTAGRLAPTPSCGLRLRVLAGSGRGPNEAGDKKEMHACQRWGGTMLTELCVLHSAADPCARPQIHRILLSQLNPWLCVLLRQDMKNLCILVRFKPVSIYIYISKRCK